MAAAVIGGVGAGISLYNGIQQNHQAKENQKRQQEQNKKTEDLVKQQMGQTNPYIDQFQQFLNSQKAPDAYNFKPTDASTIKEGTGRYDASMVDLSKLGQGSAPRDFGQVNAGSVSMDLVSDPREWQAQGYDASQVDLSQLSLPQLASLGSMQGQDGLNQFLRRDPSTQFDANGMLGAIQGEQGKEIDRQSLKLAGNVSSLGKRAGTAANIGQAMLRSDLSSKFGASNADLLRQINDAQQNRTLQAAIQQSNVGTQLAGMGQQGDISLMQARAGLMGQNASMTNQARQFGSDLNLRTQGLNQQAIEAAQQGRLTVGTTNAQLSTQAAIASMQAKIAAAGMDQSDQQFGQGQLFQGMLANQGATNQAGQFNAGMDFNVGQFNAGAQNQNNQFNQQMGLNSWQANTGAQQTFQQMMMAGQQGLGGMWQNQQNSRNGLVGIQAGVQPVLNTQPGYGDSSMQAMMMPFLMQRLMGGGGGGQQFSPTGGGSQYPGISNFQMPSFSPNYQMNQQGAPMMGFNDPRRRAGAPGMGVGGGYFAQPAPQLMY